MSGLIKHYLLLEILKSSAATTLILFIIFMSNKLGRALSDISDGDLPKQMLWIVLGSQSVQILSLLLPIGFFLGIIFAFGRLYKDHEMVVLFSCGAGYRNLYQPVLLLLIPFFALDAFFSVWLNAEVLQFSQQMVMKQQNVHEFTQLRSGQFNSQIAKGRVFYMDSISEDRRQIQNIILGQKKSQAMMIETARSGQHKIDEQTGDLFLEVGPGSSYEGRSGEKNYRIIEFETHGVLLRKKRHLLDQKKKIEQHSIQQLIQSKSLKAQIEIYWRLAVPLSLLVLALLAVPLSYIKPRQGRYGKVAVSLLIFIIYLNLLVFAKGQMESGNLSITINFWWIHGFFLALGLVLLHRRRHYT